MPTGDDACIESLTGSNFCTLVADLIVFDQSAYWINATNQELKNPNLPKDGSGGTSDLAYAFIPPACKKGAGGQPCRMHLYHHGCVSTGCCCLAHIRAVLIAV